MPVPTDERRASRRPRARTWLPLVLLAVALVFAALALQTQWDDVQGRIDDLSATRVGASVALAAGALVASMLAWRACLNGLDEHLEMPVAARVFFIGQVAKYIPGSVWTLVGQVELARAAGVRRERALAAGVLVFGISLGVALVLALFAVPALVDADGGVYLWFLLLLVPLGLALRPSNLDRLVGACFRVLRRESLDTPVRARLVIEAGLLSVVSNGLLGLQVWQLSVDLGGSGWNLLARAVGGYAIAAAVSAAVLPLPAGAGLREALLVLVLAPEIGTAAATLVAVVARLTLAGLDVGFALAAAPLPRRNSTDRGDHHVGAEGLEPPTSSL